MSTAQAETKEDSLYYHLNVHFAPLGIDCAGMPIIYIQCLLKTVLGEEVLQGLIDILISFQIVFTLLYIQLS